MPSKSGLVLINSAWLQHYLLAIKPDGTGDVTESHVVCTDDYLFTKMTNGKVHCIEIATGNILWVKDMGKEYSSAVLANDLLYVPNDEVLITLIKPGPTFEPIARNSIGERMNASTAISNGKIYLRGDKHLVCIGK